MTTSKAPNPVNVSVIIPQQTLAYPSRRATPLVSTPGSVLGPSNPSFSLMTNSCHNLLSLASLPLMSISPQNWSFLNSTLSLSLLSFTPSKSSPSTSSMLRSIDPIQNPISIPNPIQTPMLFTRSQLSMLWVLLSAV